MAKSKVKIPKTIAGVKVPKAVRKSPLLDGLLTDPAARQILADALVAAAGAVAAVLVEKRPGTKRIAEAGRTVAVARDDAASSARDIGGGIADLAAAAVGGAAKAVLPASLTGSGESSGDAKERGPRARKGRPTEDGE